MKGDTENVECYIQELKENVGGTPRAQKTMTSHDERIGEILGYGNGERLENVQDERKALDDH